MELAVPAFASGLKLISYDSISIVNERWQNRL